MRNGIPTGGDSCVVLCWNKTAGHPAHLHHIYCLSKQQAVRPFLRGTLAPP